MPRTTETRGSITLRLSADELALIEAAATARGETRSDFIRNASLRAASRPVAAAQPPASAHAGKVARNVQRASTAERRRRG